MGINMTIDIYEFWYMIQGVANKLDDLTEYKENNWSKNFAFKENLDFNIKFVNELLGFKALNGIDNLKIKPRKEVNKKNESI
ncbi:unnamed protein product [marine sediment metagenome]|uniref:Uncharacterized protein n=1 Tax=marine sediment metagenome TaxID=412755 RepID=X1TCJ6_9ZZZZ